jgi:hypothetical protein
VLKWGYCLRNRLPASDQARFPPTPLPPTGSSSLRLTRRSLTISHSSPGRECAPADDTPSDNATLALLPSAGTTARLRFVNGSFSPHYSRTTRAVPRIFGCSCPPRPPRTAHLPSAPTPRFRRIPASGCCTHSTGQLIFGTDGLARQSPHLGSSSTRCERNGTQQTASRRRNLLVAGLLRAATSTKIKPSQIQAPWGVSGQGLRKRPDTPPAIFFPHPASPPSSLPLRWRP